jgi:hypothetical protein
MFQHGIEYLQDKSLVLNCTGYSILVFVGFELYVVHSCTYVILCGVLSVQSNASAVWCWQGIGVNCHGIKGIQSMGIQCGVTLGEDDFLKLKQSSNGLGIFDMSNVL